MTMKSRMKLLLASVEVSITASGEGISVIPSWEAYSTEEVQLGAGFPCPL